MENQLTYRVKTTLGENRPINIPISLMQEYNSLEILSLKVNTDDTYRSYTSTEGIVIGRVSTANNGLGIPNVRVSIFVPKGTYSQTDEEEVLYPFSSPTDMDGDRVRYNLLPSDSDVECYQVIGTLPTKRKILDNETVLEVFDKYYKYTTVTNEAGDFMLSNIPVGKQRIHIDADLSDIGPFLSQKPYDMIENLGFEKNRFESTRQFKTSKDLDSLAQVISQNKSVYVYPYWGDATEKSSEMKITRTDLSLNYEFKTSAVFIGSVITDKQSNSLRQNCTATENAGKMSDMVTGPGRIEMIRKTISNGIEQYRIKGDELINDNGVWCYSIPMNLDYVRTDEYGNIIPTDDPNKGVPTRARVRFRITLNEMESDNDAHKRCSYLVPNNPKFNDEKFLKENDADYSFGTDTWDESFVDLFWNKVYTVKNYVPRIQKTTRPTNRKHTGIKMVNHFGDNNPFPYNNMSIKLPFTFRLICVIVKVIIAVIIGINTMLSIIGGLPCWLANLKLPLIGGRPFKFVMKFVPGCIQLSSDFCDDGINKNVTYPGCTGCIWDKKSKPDCDKDQYSISKKGGEAAVCTNNTAELYTCIENELAQQNEATSFNFSNDWINGCLYMPLWYRKIRPKKSFFFGLFKRKAKDQWCAGERNETGRQLKLASFCSHNNSKTVTAKNYEGDEVKYHITKIQDICGDDCHEIINYVGLTNGVIINRENIYGQKVWYYKAVEATSSLTSGIANEYENYNMRPMVSKTLYATDIVLLGSLSDCDLNGIPKFFNYLKGSTYNMPSDILFSDTEIEYTFDENGKFKSQENHKISVSSGCDWGNENEYGYDDGGLFYSIGCSTIEVNTESCINLRRICELGVGQDEMQYVENIDTTNATGIGGVTINSENDELDYNNLDYYLRPDGFISYDDIIDFNYRSMFATLNGNNLSTKINKETGVREYDFRHLYIDNFDGSLEEIMKSVLSKKNANYKYNYLLEKTNTDYLTFRMGDRPYYYDGESLVQGNENSGPQNFTLPKYQNSFYFYFGLKEGKTAVDLFNEQYNGSCSTKIIEGDTIPYEKRSNSWCVVDSDVNGTYNHKSFDGYIKIDLDKISLPCSAILNSVDNNAVTYTITSYDGNTNIIDDKICFYGNGVTNDDINYNLSGYKRYYFRYENPAYSTPVDTNELYVEGEEDVVVSDVTKGPCVMLNNGEYKLLLTDGDGNQHSFNINMKNDYLQFDDIERKFGQPNKVLLNYYKTVGGEGSSISYNSVAKSPDPSTNKINISIDSSGIPVVDRHDYAMKYTEKGVVTDSDGKKSYIKLNGTICLFNLLNNNEKLDKFIIEVEPYDKEKINGEDYYLDEDFQYSPSGGITDKTWYQVKMFNDHEANITNKDCNVNVGIDGREYVTVSNDSQYFYYEELTYNEGLKLRCYVIKCPKGGVNYRVRVTQLCKDNNGKYYKTQNYIERKINVGEPTPYKLLINDVDYDIIKDFRTGWELPNKKELQTGELYGKNNYKPFASLGDFSKIKGWLEISDINKNYAWGEDPDNYGIQSLTFEKYEDGDHEGEYKLNVALSIKENAKPIEPQRYNYNNESEYNVAYRTWLQKIDEWENGCVDDDGNRVNYYNDWENGIDEKHELGGVCGYTYIEENAKILINRLNFVDKMKSSFWIQSEDEEKTITYSVRTDDNPYDVWTIYNPEYVSPSDDEYNECDSENADLTTKRHYWKCVGESTRIISGIKIPNITSYDSKDFGMSEDSVRQTDYYKTTYNGDKTMCFAQDNIAENSKDSGSISIKPPYMVACVNYEGITKPYNLRKGYFFDRESDDVSAYKFGDVGDNKQYIKDGESEFFQFYLIDKIFSPDIVCWSYMNNIPYYLPWYDYDTEANDENKLGYSVKVEGILSGVINNGVTSSVNENGYVNDFDATNIFEKQTTIKTFKNASEDDIPTKRCILYGKVDDEGNNLTYVNYRHTGEDNVNNSNQYRPVPNREGELEFTDKDSNSTTKRTLYGAMRIILKSTTLNTSAFQRKLFQSSGDENVDTSLTLRVSCSNSDTENPITYYLFEVSTEQKVEVESGTVLKRVWYPLNKFDIDTTVDGTKFIYSIQCGEELSPWDGTTKNAQQIFNKNTLEKHFKDKYNDNPDLDLACSYAKSEVQYENDEGETKAESTVGYGNTGVFTQLKHAPYFVVAVTENNCRAISPVYDFHMVYYVAGFVETASGQKVLRTALVYILKPDGHDIKPNNIGKYSKQPRNYYLTQYDFTVSYTFTNGTTMVTNEGITYEKSNIAFKDGSGFDSDDLSGTSWVEELGGNPPQYVIHTKTGGSVIEGETSEIKPSGTMITAGDYEYKTLSYDSENQKDEEVWNTVTIDSNGNLIENGQYDTDQGLPILPNNFYIEITTTKTDPETGQIVTTLEYKLFTYSEEITATVNYNPRIPYFIRYNDKAITDDEYESLNNLFKMTAAQIEKNVQYYVTDVTGLRHKCYLLKIIKTQTEWTEKVLQCP